MIHEGNNAVLLIATTYEEDSGTFSCRATTSAGTVETSAKLIVKSKNWSNFILNPTQNETTQKRVIHANINVRDCL